MTRDQAVELARQRATRTIDKPYHEYQPTPEKARNWQPHEWVIDAILAAHSQPPCLRCASMLRLVEAERRSAAFDTLPDDFEMN